MPRGSRVGLPGRGVRGGTRLLGMGLQIHAYRSMTTPIQSRSQR